MIKYGAVALATLFLAGCASKSNNIEAAYVSPMKYNSYECSQMEQEYARVLQKSSSVNKDQDRISSNDAVATGVGVVLFWPALFFIDSDDRREEVAQLKGELDAIEQATIQKNCTDLNSQIQDDRRAAAKAEAARKKKEAEQADGLE